MQAPAESIRLHLPRLRRYAAAVTGSLRTGDRYLELCLETLIQEPERIDPGHAMATQLFELLHDAIDACGLEDESPIEIEFDGNLRRAILRLPPTDRRLVLLTLLEGFSLECAADILVLPRNEVQARLATACAVLRDVCIARILVIESNKPVADNLVDLISQSGHTLVGVAADTRSAAALAQRRHPDLIVADLHRGMGGIGPMRAMLEEDGVPVVFLGGRPAALRRRGAPVFVIDDLRDTRLVEDAITRALFCRAVSDNTAYSIADG